MSTILMDELQSINTVTYLTHKGIPKMLAACAVFSVGVVNIVAMVATHSPWHIALTFINFASL